MRTIPRIICLWLFCTAFTAVGIGAETASPLLQAMREELNRSIDLLKRQPVPPYYLSYEITETHLIRIGASFGALSYNNERRSRMLEATKRGGFFIPRMVLFEDITLKPPTGEIAKAPVSPHPFFAGKVTQ